MMGIHQLFVFGLSDMEYTSMINSFEIGIMMILGKLESFTNLNLAVIKGDDSTY